MRVLTFSLLTALTMGILSMTAFASLPPSVTTMPATDMTGYSATLNSTVNPNGFPTQVYYRYAQGTGGFCSDTFGTAVPGGGGTIISGTSPVSVPHMIQGGLFPGWTYSYCVVALNFEGRVFGEMVSFTTTNELPTVSGTVTYGNAIGAPSPRYVSDVTITIVGSGANPTTTAGPGPNVGQYSLPVFFFTFCWNTPSKTGGVNGISSNDAARIAQHVSGINPLSGNQLIVADVSGDGTISSFDAAQIARFTAGLGSQTGSTGTWRFTPVNIMYPRIMGNYTAQDFSALLMGEVSGNWSNTGARPTNQFNPNTLAWLISPLY